jgi:hypothetical protein
MQAFKIPFSAFKRERAQSQQALKGRRLLTRR